ncbi:MAG: hypothetical protein ABSH47_05685 [Bryobacteraceae bacterium]
MFAKKPDGTWFVVNDFGISLVARQSLRMGECDSCPNPPRHWLLDVRMQMLPGFKLEVEMKSAALISASYSALSSSLSVPSLAASASPSIRS